MSAAPFRASALALLAGLLLACSGEDAASLPPAQPLCDGGDEPRLVFTSIRGFGSFGTQFSGKYGSGYVVVDGRCDYWVGSEGLRGLRTGTLDREASAALAEQLHFGRYFTVAGHRDPGGCTDANLAVLDDGSTRLESTCLGREGPRVYWEAFYRAFQLHGELDASSAPAWERTRLLAVRAPAQLAPALPGEPRAPLAWTAALDLEARAVDGIELSRGLDPDAGVLVEDAPTLAVLAELRTRARNPDPNSLDVLVVDEQGRAYQLLVRDEPPDRVRDALERALAPEAAR